MRISGPQPALKAATRAGDDAFFLQARLACISVATVCFAAAAAKAEVAANPATTTAAAPDVTKGAEAPTKAAPEIQVVEASPGPAPTEPAAAVEDTRYAIPVPTI